MPEPSDVRTGTTARSVPARSTSSRRAGTDACDDEIEQLRERSVRLIRKKPAFLVLGSAPPHTLAPNDAKSRSKLRFVPPDLLAEPFGVLAAHEIVHSVSEWVVRARMEIADRAHDHGRDDDGLGVCRRDGFSGHG